MSYGYINELSRMQSHSASHVQKHCAQGDRAAKLSLFRQLDNKSRSCQPVGGSQDMEAGRGPSHLVPVCGCERGDLAARCRRWVSTPTNVDGY